MAPRARRSQEMELLAQRVADQAASDQDLLSFKHLLDSDPELAADVEGARAQSALLRDALLAPAADVDFRAMQASVFQAIDAPAAPVRAGLWSRLSDLKLPWLWPALAAATAAGLALLIPALTPEPSTVPQALANGGFIELHSLDTGDATAVVFQAPTSGTTVIWVAESEEADDEGEEEAVPDALALPDEVASEVGPGVEKTQ